jgi:hypothetical protein
MAGPDAGPDTAAAEPRELGHLRRDERGAPVRGNGPGGGGAAHLAFRPLMAATGMQSKANREAQVQALQSKSHHLRPVQGR